MGIALNYNTILQAGTSKQFGNSKPFNTHPKVITLSPPWAIASNKVTNLAN
jgi:hypothetical protein